MKVPYKFDLLIPMRVDLHKCEQVPSRNFIKISRVDDRFSIACSVGTVFFFSELFSILQYLAAKHDRKRCVEITCIGNDKNVVNVEINQHWRHSCQIRPLKAHDILS